VHKGRRWRLNKKVPSQRVAVIASFINLQKLWYLLALSSHCPHHRHLEWLRLMRAQLWSICLTNHKLSREVRIPKPHATRLRSQASSYHCKHTCIIENANRVPLARWHGNMPTSKWQDKQIMNTSASLLFTIGIAFYFWDASSNVHYGLICLKRIYNFWCSILVYTPFALCFVTLRGVFMHFPELTY
jgi:hypothetical protein